MGVKPRFYLERILVGAVMLGARALPRKLVIWFGDLFGRFAYHADFRHRRVALENLGVAFPEQQERDRRALLKRCYRFFARYLFDMLTFFPAFPPSRMSDFEFEGLENVENGYRMKKGVIFYTGHWGAWELMALAHGFNGHPFGVIARSLDNPYLHRLLDTLRCSTGNFVIDKKRGFRPMLKTLRDGQGIAILIDQNVTTEERIFVDFFGRSASTTPAVGLLHLKTGAALIGAFALPLGNGRYRFSYTSPLTVELSGDRKEDVRRITQSCTRVIEDQIRRYPEYWLWMHRRWKTRPASGATDGEMNIEERVMT